MRQLFYFLLFSLPGMAFSQTKSRLNTDQLYVYGLQGDVQKIFSVLDTAKNLSQTEQVFKDKYENRFKSLTDKYDVVGDATIQQVLNTYTAYWRKMLLKTTDAKQAEAELAEEVKGFLAVNYPGKDHSHFPTALNAYLSSKGYFSATGKTGAYFDLYLWKKETEENYKVALPEEETTVKVVFLEDVKTMGWEDYATFGTYYPGGWATSDRLYCVKKAYDVSSENFQVSYLKHEGQHFADYKNYPELTSADLEYRAKLSEIVLSDATTQRLLTNFINNSKNDRGIPHSFANYHVIDDLSQQLFKEAHVKDIERWKAIPVKDLKDAAKELLVQHSKNLKQAGAETVKEYIK